MRIHTLKRRQGVAGRPAEVFQFFADAYNLEKITPLWLRLSARSQPLEMVAGAEIRYSLLREAVAERLQERLAPTTRPTGEGGAGVI